MVESSEVVMLAFFFVVLLLVLFASLMFFIERGEWVEELGYYARPNELPVSRAYFKFLNMGGCDGLAFGGGAGRWGST